MMSTAIASTCRWNTPTVPAVASCVLTTDWKSDALAPPESVAATRKVGGWRNPGIGQHTRHGAFPMWRRRSLPCAGARRSQHLHAHEC